MRVRETFRLLALAYLLPLAGETAASDARWLRLERLNETQQGELDTRQRRYSKGAQPLPPSDQRQMERQFRQQQQRQQSLQDRQLRERSLLRQRQRAVPEFERNSRRQLKLQQFQRQQGGLQNRLHQQRRSWRYGR